MNIDDAAQAVAQAKVMFDATGMSDEMIKKLAGEFGRIFESRHPGVSGVAKALLQPPGSRRWKVLGKIEINE